MKDEIGDRRAAKRQRTDAKTTALNAVIEARAAELRSHGPAIIELLHAVALMFDQVRPPKPSRVDLHIAEFAWLVAKVLGMSKAQSMDILTCINNSGGDETE